MHNKLKSRAISISVLSNLILVTLKLLIGILGGSVSIISEAIHSGIDLLAALIAWCAILASSKPADARHPYGHGKFENLSGTIEALLIFFAAAWIVYESIYKLLNPIPIKQLDISIMVMIFSSIVNFFISNYLIKIGKTTDSIAIIADAWHLRTDVYTSAGVMVSLCIMWIIQNFWPKFNIYWLDPVTAIIVAFLIIHAALKLSRQAILDLVDVSLPNSEVLWINTYLQSLAPTICGFHNLRTRKAGSSRFIEVHVVVNGKMTVNASHDITRDISSKIRSHFTETNVIIRIEPCNQHQPSNICPIHCRRGCLIDQ